MKKWKQRINWKAKEVMLGVFLNFEQNQASCFS